MGTAAVRRQTGRQAWAAIVLATLTLLVLLSVWIAVVIFLGRALGLLHGLQWYVGAFIVGIVLGEWSFLGLLVAWLARRGVSLQDLGWLRPTRASAIGLGVLAAAAYIALEMTTPTGRSYVLELTPLKLLVVVAALTAGVVEETLCRGFVITQLAAARSGVAVQVVASGVVYAALHVAWGPLGILLTLPLGLAFAGIYVYGRRSLTPVMVSHALIDLVLEPGLLLFSLGGSAGGWK